MSINKNESFEIENEINEPTNNPNQQLKRELALFNGSENIYRIYKNVNITEGVKFLAEKTNAFWIIDIVYSYQSIPKVHNEYFQCYELKVDLATEKGTIICTDGNENILGKQGIPFCTFPLEAIKLYFIDDVLMLITEY